VSRELQRRSIKTKWGRESWSVAVLCDVLQNDIYLGVYRFRKSKHGKDVDGSRYKIAVQDQIVAGSREKPNHPPIVTPDMFELVQKKLQTNRRKNSTRLHMATGLLLCPVCGSRMNVKYSSAPGYRYNGLRAAKYTCLKRPGCRQNRIPIDETNDRLWGALLEVIVRPERIQDLIVPTPETDLTGLKKQMAETEREERTLKEKQQRLLDLYLEGNIPQASYVVKSGQMEAEAERLAQTRATLHQKMASHGKKGVTDGLVQTLRLLARSHRRFTEEQKTKVFRSMVKEARLSETGVELEMYVQATQNVWWKYRHKAMRQPTSAKPNQTVRVRIQQSAPDNHLYTTGQAAQMLGISTDLLLWRINSGKYPEPPKTNGTHRRFTHEHIQKLRAIPHGNR